MSAENEALVRRYVEEVYDQRKLEVIDEIFSGDFTLHDPDLPGGAQGPEGITRVVETFVDAFPDLQVTLDDELSSGDKVVTRWTSRGTHQGELMGIAPTGRPIEVTAVGIWRVADGKIAEAWLVFDALGMMQQLGVASSS
jgi:steroid delta-isomerase-like uncharacterized protein